VFSGALQEIFSTAFQKTKNKKQKKNKKRFFWVFFKILLFNLFCKPRAGTVQIIIFKQYLNG
jgi:hypothetical protein